MKRCILFFTLLIFGGSLFGQDDAEKSYSLVEHVIISANKGANDAFEKAVVAHNKNHHSGAHSAFLMRCATGKNVGTYRWGMGPCTYTDLDSRPSDEAHDKDWKDNVGKHVNKVHSVEYWRKMDKLSYTAEDEEYDKLSIWFLDIKDGEFYRFRSFMEKIQPIFEAMNETNTVWSKQFNEDDGVDVAIVWRMNGWADMDDPGFKMKEEYDKVNGEGSWDDALEEWEDFVKSRKSEVWEIVR